MTKKKQKKQKYYVYYSVSKREGVFSNDETAWEKTKVKQKINSKELKNTVKEICETINKEIDAIGFSRVTSSIKNDVNICGEKNTILDIYMMSPDLDICWHWYLSVSVEKN